MRPARCVLLALVLAFSGIAAPAEATHRPPYVPEQHCAYVLSPFASEAEDVCTLDLERGAHEVDLSALFGTTGSFAVEAAFADGRIFWSASCTLTSPTDDWTLRCESSGWGSGSEGTRSWYSETTRAVIAIEQQGISGLLPDGGSVALRAGPGDGALLLTTRRVPA